MAIINVPAGEAQPGDTWRDMTIDRLEFEGSRVRWHYSNGLDTCWMSASETVRGLERPDVPDGHLPREGGD